MEALKLREDSLMRTNVAKKEVEEMMEAVKLTETSDEEQAAATTMSTTTTQNKVRVLLLNQEWSENEICFQSDDLSSFC